MGMPIREVYLFRNFLNSKLWKCNGPILMLADLEECKWHDQNTEWHTFADFADGLKCIYVWHTVRNVELLWVKYVKKCNEPIGITWCRLTNWNAMAPPGWPILMPEIIWWNIPNWMASHQKYDMSEKPTWTWMQWKDQSAEWHVHADLLTVWNAFTSGSPREFHHVFALLNCTWKKIHFKKYILKAGPNFWHLEGGKTLLKRFAGECNSRLCEKFKPTKAQSQPSNRTRTSRTSGLEDPPADDTAWQKLLLDLNFNVVLKPSTRRFPLNRPYSPEFLMQQKFVWCAKHRLIL